MGFQHYLKVVSNEKVVDVGGYSKGGSKPHWFFAFSPTEYRNNLETVLKEKNWSIVSVNYETTVGQAIERLNNFYDRLYSCRDKILLKKEENFFGNLLNNIYYLHVELEKYNSSDMLVLDQTDGALYALKENENKEVIGLETWWYLNRAADNEKTIQQFEEAKLSLEDMVESFLQKLPNEEIEGFFQELVAWTAEEERSNGSHFIMEVIVKRNCTISNNPQIVFKSAMDTVLEKYYNSEAELRVKKNSYSEEPVDEKSVVQAIIILEDLIHEALNFLKERS